MNLRAGLLLILLLLQCAHSEEIIGVQSAALDQPRVFMAIWRDPKGKALEFDKKQMPEADILKGLGLGMDENDGPAFSVRAFLDTGASDIMLSDNTAKALGVKSMMIANQQAYVYDIGVSGEEAFEISEPVYVGISNFSSSEQGENPASYRKTATATPLKLRTAGGVLDQLTGGIEIAGMPVMMGKVVTIDARGLDQLDLLKTRIVEKNDPSIPKTDSTIKLTYIDFTRFTRVEPKNTRRPISAPNPMIGPNPFVKNDQTKPVVISHQGKIVPVTLLLDTGAASSMISSRVAEKMGIKKGADGLLTGVPREKQFQLPIGGIGGASNVTGFFADTLTLPVMKGEPLIFKGAPVLIKDITVTDPVTKEEYTLDGIFGMNYLVASVEITGGMLPDIGKSGGGPFQHIVIDNAAGELRLKLNK